MKKTVHAILLICLIPFSYQCKKNNPAEKKSVESTKKTVNAQSGLRIRDVPATDGKIIAVIPDKNEVVFIEEKGDSITVGSAVGKWTKITWRDKTGWVFGGFLIKASAAEKTAQKKSDKAPYPQSANGWHYLNKIPDKWIVLLEKGDDHYTFTPCNEAETTIRIDKSEPPAISFGAGTCSISCQIESIRYNTNPEVNYTYFFKGTCQDCTGQTMKQTEIKMFFIPGPDESIMAKSETAMWGGEVLGNRDTLYVPEKNRSMYKRKNEECK